MNEVHVFVEWEGRNHPLGRVARRRRRILKKVGERPGSRHLDPGIDGSGCFDFPDFLDELALVFAVIGLIVVLVWLAPVLASAALWLLLLVLFTVLLIVGAIWRTVFRRPWRVVALSKSDKVWVWHRVGFLHARRLVEEIKAAGRLGAHPHTVAMDDMDPASPIDLADVEPSPFDHPVAKWVALLLLVAAGLTFLVLTVT